VDLVGLAGVDLGPGIAVSGIGRYVEAIDYRLPAGEVADGLDFDVVLAGAGAELWIDCDGHGDGIGQGDAALAGLFEVGILRDRIAADREFSERRF